MITRTAETLKEMQEAINHMGETIERLLADLRAVGVKPPQSDTKSNGKATT